jgi:osmotically-inducible protein OsmY
MEGMKTQSAWSAILLVVVLLHGCASDNAAHQRDLSITSAVQKMLEENQEANLIHVDVYTEAAIVYLSGELPEYEQKLQAEHLARNVRGVKKVFNKIQVEP